MNKNIFVRLLIGLIAVALFFGGTQFIYIQYSNYRLKKNHEAVQDFVNRQLTFEPEALDDQLAATEKWMESDYLYPEDYGMIYERAGNIYKFKEDYANYARSFGYAMYYLEQSPDIDYTVNLELDLAMFYTVNNNYDLAKDVINRMLVSVDTSRVTNPQVKSYLARFIGILAIRDGDLEKAEEQLFLAKQIIDEAPHDFYTDSYRGINQVNIAKLRFSQGRFDEAEEIIEGIKGSDLFLQSEYASIKARDFVLPYYELRIALALERGEDVIRWLEPYVKECEEYGYNQWELQTLMYVKDKIGFSGDEEYKEINDMLEKAYTDSARYQGTRYTNLLNGIIKDSHDHMKEIYEQEREQRTRLFIYLMLFVMLIWISLFLWAVIKKSKLDGLTGIGSRGAFDSEMYKNKRPYGIIMIDIDNFKKVNDTYGHQKGDEVLKRLGQILMDMRTSDIHPFRYGGEEFVVVVYARSLQLVVNIAEHIRKIFETQEWEFGAKITISLGCAVSSGGGDVVKRADDNLYISKKIGKNRVTS
ncbi:MAG: diguanylate cyclase [Lachnospiraceae bacterium]|nr:diguanylate cyclase [Lachnospiraceae bacterium]